MIFYFSLVRDFIYFRRSHPLHSRGNTPPGLTRASLPVRGNDRSVGPVEGLTQVFAVGVPGDTLCLKKSVGSNSECLTEFPIPDEGPIVFDCNKDYSAITDYMRDPECGGLHKFLPVSLVPFHEEKITRMQVWMY